MKHKITIGWLYPEFMNIYGDRGNILVLQKRCTWRGLKAEVKLLELGFSEKELYNCDILMMGGAQDLQQKIVSDDLLPKRKALSSIIEAGVPGLYVCGAYQFLGNYYKDADGKIIEGLKIFDLHTVNPGEKSKRLIGNLTTRISMSIDSPLTTLVGFENHGGRTYLGKKVKSLAKVLNGHGNNGEDLTEGAFYKNSIGTYMHGPILPKNPHLADYLIKCALQMKDRSAILPLLDDTVELNAHKAIAKRMGIEI
ncbi:MAG: hypothetical protein ACD_37C00493G0002 [uncultured bacterium]|nr:MAG: hypothetical protein ACD_37C00493G0002 [uncultured bacterium]KKR95242.1 MAG: hypothetical protein UU45_C0003G0028 [Candidatus Levybacteria bacterium GW2011_GWA2_41_15]OGH50324.1 MAG: hypothetical protein A3J18_04555 [Candidatus Levybacteria bacterium RIFCSPLOWO2_02_FULL_40_18]OGH52228.1 MAG: hypothetical protein A3H20_04540 [Candidatus Levybacteria bacterium RIFCSPLOWO2_12_FULL_41_12]OGH54238.1 MAG: hypothetical protein A2596_00180 [Candidatus Levybacteria bacterium RIFOXYD1_FULL_40_21]